ncbi:preprotein translocase subunit SecA, partial [Flavobacteriaceae bacterium]|nr:preprotein translocase subunit SecA [Flavobacteriaceae bacterium]
PLLIYKFEAFELFQSMILRLNKEVLSFLLKGTIPSNDNNSIKEAKKPSKLEKIKTSKDDVLNTEEMAVKNRAIGGNAGQGRSSTVETIVRELPKIGRNDRVVIKNVQNGESKTLKFKQAEPLISTGQWVLLGKN